MGRCICGTEDPEELEEQLKDLWEEMKNFKKEESTCVEWEVKVERDGKDIRLGNTLDDRVWNELYNWGIECGGEEGNGNLGEGGGEEIEGEVWKKIQVTFDWLCVADLAACWKIYLFGGFRDGNNCPFCDVDGPDERGKVFDSCWGTWKEGYSKEGLESVMGLSLSDFCICSLHMMLRVVNYLVLRLCLLCMDGRKDTLVQELAGLLEKVGAGWRMYEDKDGERQLKSYSGAECKKILEHVGEFNAFLHKNKKIIKEAIENEKEKKKKKQGEAKGKQGERRGGGKGGEGKGRRFK